VRQCLDLSTVTYVHIRTCVYRQTALYSHYVLCGKVPSMTSQEMESMLSEMAECNGAS